MDSRAHAGKPSTLFRARLSDPRAGRQATRPAAA